MATANQPTARPTNKWFASAVAAAATIAVSIIEAGWVDATQISTVGIVSGLVIAYLVPNEATSV